MLFAFKRLHTNLSNLFGFSQPSKTQGNATPEVGRLLNWSTDRSVSHRSFFSIELNCEHLTRGRFIELEKRKLLMFFFMLSIRCSSFNCYKFIKLSFKHLSAVILMEHCAGFGWGMRSQTNLSRFHDLIKWKGKLKRPKAAVKNWISMTLFK